MKGPVWPWVVATCGIAFGIAVWFSSRSAASDDDARIASLEQKLEALTNGPGQAAPMSQPDAADTSRRMRSTAGAPDGMHARDAEMTKGELQAVYAREAVDRAWAPTTESNLMQVAKTDAILAIEAAPPTSQRIDCRSTTCRMEFSFANDADATDWTLAYLTGIGNNLSRVRTFTDRQPDGSTSVTMYGYK